MTEHREYITLREYVDVRFEAQEKAVQSALASADRAVAKAESANDKRFDGVNEFRASLNDQTRTLMPRIETEQIIRTMNEKIDVLTVRVNAREDRGQGRGDVWGFIVGAAGFVTALISIIFAIAKGHT